MKSQQETTSLGQIVTVTAKPTISDKHLQTPTQDVLKFRRATWDPPLAGPFPSFLKPLFQSKANEVIDMKLILYSHANKTHFHNKGFVLSLVFKVRVSGPRKFRVSDISAM